MIIYYTITCYYYYYYVIEYILFCARVSFSLAWTGYAVGGTVEPWRQAAVNAAAADDRARVDDERGCCADDEHAADERVTSSSRRWRRRRGIAPLPLQPAGCPWPRPQSLPNGSAHLRGANVRANARTHTQTHTHTARAQGRRHRREEATTYRVRAQHPPPRHPLPALPVGTDSFDDDDDLAGPAGPPSRSVNSPPIATIRFAVRWTSVLLFTYSWQTVTIIVDYFNN